MNDSIIDTNSIPATDKAIATAYDIYMQLLSNTKILNRHICSICSSYVGINVTRPRNHFHGSEFAECYRRVQLDIISPKEKDENEYLNNIFLADGHLHEVSTIALLEHSYKITHRDEEKIIERIVELPTGNEKVKVVMHTDALLTYSTGNQKFVVELKAVKDWFWKNRLLKKQIPIKYYGQTQMYMEAYDIPNTILLFKNRHTSEIYPPIVIPKDDIFIRQRFQFLAGIQYSIKLPELVPREYQDKKCDACKFCPYFKFCWENE